MLEQYKVNEYQFDDYLQLNDNLLYLDWIDNNYNFKYITTTPDMGYRYQGNLFGLFRNLEVPPNLFLYMMYVNGYTNPVEYDGTQLTFKLPIKPPIPTS